MKTFVKNPLLLLATCLALIPPGRATAQTFTSLHNFTGGSDGSVPYVGVVISGDTLYGSANSGGTNGNGVVYAIKTNGVGFTVLHDFMAASDGANPNELILSGDTLYGTASSGGSSGKGTIFSIKTNGLNFTVLYTFTNGTSSDPKGALILLGNTLYGVAGGISDLGTVFKVDANGNNFTTLHSFTGTGGEGGHPGAGLVLSGNTLYGTTSSGSAVIDGYVSAGTIFAIGTDGNNFTTLHSFPGGYYAGNPYCQLVLSGNVLYGTTFGGGGDLINHGTLFSVEINGNNFTTLHNFMDTDGANPYAGLILSGNTLYGTSSCSDVGTPGTVFSVKTDGSGFTVLYSFTGG
ncbi:MAG TPA: choice-of-anchor tandem repeat GloVer-containing protein, partial [Verrucomicrobiae bacterium]